MHLFSLKGFVRCCRVEGYIELSCMTERFLGLTVAIFHSTKIEEFITKLAKSSKAE